MTLIVKHRLSDGTTVVTDPADGARFVVKAAEWDAIAALPPGEQRAAVEAAVLKARTAGDPRTQAEQEQVQANEQGSGERHEREGKQ